MNRWLEMTCYGLVQAAEMAGVSRATFWRLIKRGVVSATRAEDGSYQIEASELDRYLTSTAIERARRGAVNKPETTGEPAHEQPHDAVHASSLEAQIAQLKWLLELAAKIHRGAARPAQVAQFVGW